MSSFSNGSLFLHARNFACMIGMIFCIHPSFGQSPAQASLEKMRQDLMKIDKSVTETESKIKEIRDARFLPDLYFALGEFLVEKSRYMYAIKVAENKGTPLNEIDFTMEKRPKFRAIEVYDILIDKFPKLAERDKAIFFKAHELRELGRLEEMVKAYAQLTREYPESSYWEESQLVIGDYFFEEKKDIDLALEMYQKIIARKKGPFSPLAQYKMGWAYLNKSKFEDSLLSFEKVLTLNSDIDLSVLPDLYRKTDVRRDALTAMVWPYSEIHKFRLEKMGLWRANALDYFRRLSPDRTGYERVLEKMAKRFDLKKNYIESTKTYFELLRLTTDLETRMDIIERLYVAMKNTFKQWPVNGFVYEVAKTIAQVRFSNKLKKAEIDKAIHDYEIFARDVATRTHKRAKTTRKKEDWNLAILDYKYYLWAFPSSKQAPILRLNLAECYFNSENSLEAAKAYENLVNFTSKKEKKKSFLESAIESYITAIRTQSKLSRLELNEVRNGLRDTGSKFIKAYPTEKSVPGIRFNIAQTHYDERNFNEAVKAFKEYIRLHPEGKDVPIAANLILDSFNQKEDFANIIKEGKALLANKNITDASLKNQVMQVIEQAEMRNVQIEAGGTSSVNYAASLLKLAGKYKGSSLGDKALYEAFVAFRSKRDPRAYQSGEQLLAQHGKSEYAQEVVTSMGQMALTTADFRRASLYFELYAEKYPAQADARALLKNAATMRELMGDFKFAAQSFRKLNDYTSAARMDFLGGDWAALQRSAPQASGIEGVYWEGLAQFRLRGISSARGSLEKATQMASGTYESQEMAAHALYLLSMGAMETYNQIRMTPGNETKAVNNKAALLKDLDAKLRKVIDFGNGRWTIAALYGLGQANREFADFIKQAPVPAGLPADQSKIFKDAISQQAAKYETSSRQYFDQCLNNAEKFEVFTLFVKGCQSRGSIRVDEAKETGLIARAQEGVPEGTKEIRDKLYDQPRDIGLLMSLANIYIKSRDYSMAELILSRASEIDPKNANVLASIGVVQLYKNDINGAKKWFDSALKENKSNSLALHGIAGLHKQFNFQARLKTSLNLAKRAGSTSGPSHPIIDSVK